MSPEQKAAFLAASGISTTMLTFWIRLLVGGVAIICALLILIGLIHYLNSNSGWDKNIFIISLFSLAFVLTMIFVFVA
jgi:hypothetical protein